MVWREFGGDTLVGKVDVASLEEGGGLVGERRWLGVCGGSRRYRNGLVGGIGGNVGGRDWLGG